MKALIFDSSSIITLALNDLLFILEPLKKAFNGNFYLTETIKHELIDKSIQTRRFMLGALMIKALIEKKIFNRVSSHELKKETNKILSMANSTFKVNDEWIRIIHEGEASCLALYNLFESDKKAIVIDERTTRMLCEAPENLHMLLESKLHRKIEAVKENYNFFREFKIIRSSELCFMAYKKHIINLPASPKEALTALLYATKYKGCAISSKEIEIVKKL